MMSEQREFVTWIFQVSFYFLASLLLFVILAELIKKGGILDSVNNINTFITDDIMPMIEDALESEKCNPDYIPKTNTGALVYDLFCQDGPLFPMTDFGKVMQTIYLINDKLTV